MPLFLLVCTLVPIVKDRLGDKSSSDNYRVIAISSLLLKIFDWIILLLHGDSLDTSDLQFGFQTGSSTLMCTWVASEVISYYNRHRTSVYCCLLDLKKAFDKVKFSTLFTKLLDNGMPKLFVRLLIMMYINQSCKVRWNFSMSASFSIVNGVRQGAVLSPSLFSLYIDKLLVSLEQSGWGCHVSNHFYGATAYADDIILLSPTRQGLQQMFDICHDYFNSHDITISTNPDPAKSKTKCIFLPYGPKGNDPMPIMMGNTPLPWVDTWPHLGNQLHSMDFSLPLKCSLKHDLLSKRGKFIGKFHDLWQEFGFADPLIVMRVINIYATSFYGSCLWDFNSPEATKLFNSWNILVRIVFNIPRNSHRYFIEELTNCKHIMSTLFQRYLGFISSLLSSKKQCLSSLATVVLSDKGSLSSQNIETIEKKSGLEDVLSVSPQVVADAIVYSEVPMGEEWRIEMLKELLLLKSKEFELDFGELSPLTSSEVDDLIDFVASS